MKFKLAKSIVYYDFSVVDSLCHEVVIGRNLLTVIRSEVSLPGGGIEVFCGNPISSCEYVKIHPGNECIIPVASWHPVDEGDNSIVILRFSRDSSSNSGKLHKQTRGNVVAKSNEPS